VLVEVMVRLGTRLPFAVVAEEMGRLFDVSVSPDTVRRLTEEAGAVLADIEQQDLERLEHDAPEELEGPAVQQVSADGCMVSLVDGRWTEVRTMAIGTVTQQEGESAVHDLTYFSRYGGAERFIRHTTLPTHERGTRRAGTVAAVMDGASWLQELIDEQCPKAVRILDFPHAVGYLHRAAHAAYGAESQEAVAWLDDWVPRFKSGDPEEVLTALRALPALTPEAATAKGAAVRYLGSRKEQIRYADFRKEGVPIGSATVVPGPCSGGPTGNGECRQLVVEARLKGSGMHWARANLNSLLGLRTRLCSGQWDQTWPLIHQQWRQHTRHRQRERRRVRQARHVVEQLRPVAAPPAKPPQPKLVVDGRPTPNHPWKGHPGIFAA
jgi:hypothetical protein